VLVVGLVLATSIPLAWELLTPPANAGTVPVATVTAAPVLSDADTSDADGPAPVDTPVVATDDGAWVEAANAVADQESDRGANQASDRGAQAGDRPVTDQPATRSARISDLADTSAPAPRRLEIPSLDVSARVGVIGVEPNGDMEVPEDVRDVGWYRFGPAPGEPGAAVIAGHVDSREQGAGAFFDLRRLAVGARVKVTNADGHVQRYDVVARRTYDKSVLPTDEVFAREGPSQLVLITCGGDFDSTAGSYRQNVVIYAQPVSASA
jgi:LPXTG-site transpeptidase (sortase) family protein